MSFTVFDLSHLHTGKIRILNLCFILNGFERFDTNQSPLIFSIKEVNTCCRKEKHFFFPFQMPVYGGMLNACAYAQSTRSQWLQKRSIPVLLLSLSVYSRSSWKGADSFDCMPLRLSSDRRKCHYGAHYTPTPLPFAPLGNRHQKGARNLSAHAGGFWLVAFTTSHQAERNLNFHTQRGEITVPKSGWLWNIPLKDFEVSDKMLSGERKTKSCSFLGSLLLEVAAACLSSFYLWST